MCGGGGWCGSGEEHSLALALAPVSAQPHVAASDGLETEAVTTECCHRLTRCVMAAGLRVRLTTLLGHVTMGPGVTMTGYLLLLLVVKVHDHAEETDQGYDVQHAAEDAPCQVVVVGVQTHDVKITYATWVVVASHDPSAGDVCDHCYGHNAAGQDEAELRHVASGVVWILAETGMTCNTGTIYSANSGFLPVWGFLQNFLQMQSTRDASVSNVWSGVWAQVWYHVWLGVWHRCVHVWTCLLWVVTGTEEWLVSSCYQDVGVVAETVQRVCVKRAYNVMDKLNFKQTTVIL